MLNLQIGYERHEIYRCMMKKNKKSTILSRRQFLAATLAATGGLVIGNANQETPAAASNPSQATSAPGATPIYADPARSVEDRVNDLVGQMTIDEKIQNRLVELLKQGKCSMT